MNDFADVRERVLFFIGELEILPPAVINGSKMAEFLERVTEFLLFWPSNCPDIVMDRLLRFCKEAPQLKQKLALLTFSVPQDAQKIFDDDDDIIQMTLGKQTVK